MEKSEMRKSFPISRRDFLRAAGMTAAAFPLSNRVLMSAAFATNQQARKKKPAVVQTAFVYPPTSSLREVGYYSWPGSSFDAEGRQRQYTARLKEVERDLAMRISINEAPLDEQASVARFIDEVKKTRPDGLLLIPFKKGHWTHVMRIIDETRIPTVVLATMGVLLVGHVRQLHRRPGVYMISSPDDLDAVEYGMRMVRTSCRMRQSLIANITGTGVKEEKVPAMGTTVRTVPHKRFYDEFKNIRVTDAVRDLADAYMKNAQRVVQPSKSDVLEAAKCYFVLKRIIEAENADAVMMNCLPGLKRPHQHVPPCMGFMNLRDEGIPAGCESDLDATLTLMLLQELFGRPGFQHNPSVDTEKNHYFGAHCTSASKMNGLEGPAEPYAMLSHAEAGWGCVPRVLFSAGQEITVTKYLSAKEHAAPQMLVYSGEILGCPAIPPTGGCRTNVKATINELEDVCDLKGHHLCMVYGNYAKQLRAFCQLYGIAPVV